MLTANFSHRLFSPFSEEGISLDGSRLANITFPYAVQIQETDLNALINNLTSVGASEIIWSSGSGAGLTQLSLTGSGIAPSSTIQELERAVQNGTATGALDGLSLTVGGVEVLSVSIGSSVLSVTSGPHTFNLFGFAPTDLTGIFQLVDLATGIGDVFNASEADFNALVDGLDGYSINGVSFSENGEELINLSLGDSSFAALTALGFTAAIQGQIDADLGALLTTLKAVGDAGNDISSVEGIEVSGLTLTAPDGTLLIEVTGAVATEEDLDVETVAINGTNEDDEISLGYGNGENANEYTFDLRSLSYDLTDGDFNLEVNSGAGDDWVDVRGAALQYDLSLMGDDKSITFDGGADWDTLFVNWAPASAGGYQPNPYDVPGYEQAFLTYALSNLPNYQSGFRSDENAWLRGDRSERPSLADYLAPHEGDRFDETAYRADFDALKSKVEADFGNFVVEYPAIGPYEDSYKLSAVLDDYVDPITFETMDPWDDTAYLVAYNDWSASGFFGDQPQLSDFPDNEDLYDHDSYATDLGIFDAFNLTRPDPFSSIDYFLADGDAPQPEDFRTRNEADFDYEAYDAALIAFNESYGLEGQNGRTPLLDSVEYPQATNFRTSSDPADYYWTPENSNVFETHDFNAYWNSQSAEFQLADQEGREPDNISLAGFRLNDGTNGSNDLYDHEGYEAAFATFQAYGGARSDTLRFDDFILGQDKHIQFDFAEGKITAFDDLDDGIVAFEMDFTNFERVGLNAFDETVEVLGNDDDNFFRANDLAPSLITFEGGAGVDRVDLNRTWIDRDAGLRGFTEATFLAMFALASRTDGTIDVVNKESGDVFMSLDSVEGFQFLPEGQTEGWETVAIADMLDGLVLEGTPEADTLLGSSGDDLITGLGGNDYINGEGGSDVVNAGEGDDAIAVFNGDSTVDGGSGYDTLVAATPDGAFMDVTFTEADGELGATVRLFENQGDADPQNTIMATSVEEVLGITEGVLEATGDANNNVLALGRSLPTSLIFNGGDGTDMLRLDRTVSPSGTDGLTQQEFNDQYILISEDDGSLTLRSTVTEQNFASLTDVETIRFAVDGEEGPGFEDVAIADMNVTVRAATPDAVDPTANVNDFVDIPDDFTGPLNTGDGNDQVEGGAGGDEVNGGDGEDEIDGGQGDDEIDGGEGADSLNGGEGTDTLNGGEGDDRLVDGADAVIDGGAGNDVGITTAGDNTFNDTGVVAFPGTDINDFYCGGLGNDYMNAGSGNDILIGDANSVYYFGQDTLDGGTGKDLLQGGLNADVFIFEAGDSTEDGNVNSTLVGDVIGQFDLDDIFSELSGGRDINAIQAQGADFEIGIDMVHLKGFTDAEQDVLRAGFTTDMGSQSGDAYYTAAGQGIAILFDGLTEAQLEAAGFDGIFEFIV
jgi:Ca2+-binding RTX toxin-like protein